MKISVIVPCYNEEEALPIFLREISTVADSMKDRYAADFELLFIDDGSRDGTLSLLRSYAQADSRVRYISFSRNFGKEAGMYAGLQNATGDFVALMDADMQDPPSLLPEMYELLQTGEYDCVATRRADRKGEPPVRSFFAHCFYRLMNRISDADIVDGARDFRLMSRAMVDSIVSMGEYNRFSKGIFGWVGFRTKWLSYDNIERAAGTTKWSFWSLFKYSMQGIMAFSTAPLAMASFIGLFFCLIAFLMIIFIVVRTLLHGDPVAGWPSMACIVIFLGGLNLFSIGILGQYVSKIYLESKHRPIYIIAEQNPPISAEKAEQ